MSQCLSHNTLFISLTTHYVNQMVTASEKKSKHTNKIFSTGDGLGQDETVTHENLNKSTSVIWQIKILRICPYFCCCCLFVQFVFISYTYCLHNRLLLTSFHKTKASIDSTGQGRAELSCLLLCLMANKELSH